MWGDLEYLGLVSFEVDQYQVKYYNRSDIKLKRRSHPRLLFHPFSDTDIFRVLVLGGLPSKGVAFLGYWIIPRLLVAETSRDQAVDGDLRLALLNILQENCGRDGNIPQWVSALQVHIFDHSSIELGCVCLVGAKNTAGSVTPQFGGVSCSAGTWRGITHHARCAWF